jgi:hypothetical protein
MEKGAAHQEPPMPEAVGEAPGEDGNGHHVSGPGAMAMPARRNPLARA